MFVSCAVDASRVQFMKNQRMRMCVLCMYHMALMESAWQAAASAENVLRAA